MVLARAAVAAAILLPMISEGVKYKFKNRDINDGSSKLR